MLEAEAFIDWDRLRSELRRDLSGPRPRSRLRPWFRFGVWTALVGGWLAVGLPLMAVPAILIFERYVAPGLAEPVRELANLRPWSPPPSFVVSPDAPPPTRTDG